MFRFLAVQFGPVFGLQLHQFKAFGSKNRTKDPSDVHWLERAMQSKVERIVTIAYLSLVKIDRKMCIRDSRTAG